MPDIAKLYVSKPTTVWATDPLTPENRREVFKWVAFMGGRVELTPEGYETGLVLHNPMHGELDVRYGDRVMHNLLIGGDFYPNAPETFEARWELSPAGDPEPGSSGLVDRPTS